LGIHFNDLVLCFPDRLRCPNRATALARLDLTIASSIALLDSALRMDGGGVKTI
jgi:hypothetical protein